MEIFFELVGVSFRIILYLIYLIKYLKNESLKKEIFSEESLEKQTKYHQSLIEKIFLNLF